MTRRRSGGSPPTQRQLRVGEELRHVLAGVLARDELRDPALQGLSITVTQVRVSPDLRNATAYVMPLGGERAADSLAALRRAAPFLRGQVGRAVELRLVPQLDFAIDTSFEHAQRIDGLLRRPEVARDLGGDEAAPDPDDEAR
ncbi:ribosome-binding factor A [Stella humosa]|uniref:Ribosome-binding factor A n=1 Tax=Stella humosa TaxID=94 RepID=A0A3N1KWT9_9PROT|nr:30S ribosome-binding factor RbfA [Stella humosa]ROP84344.1 ribosome-binding factor A [Stella humosa]BBK33859.1 ribosome-binding factor A [Stella humosa]